MTAWRYLTEDDVGAAAGLAADEALMHAHARDRDTAPPVLRLYTYASHAALCGRYQHLEAEIDVDACARTGTAFNRRPTGGGAIVMGEGQLGVAVVTRAPSGDRPKSVLVRFSTGIVAGLARLGIDASFGGKNDLKVEGRKIAGLGLYLDGEGGLLFHASVLADLDVAFMLDVLDIPAAKLGERAVAAVNERVTTVSRETGEPWTGASLRDVIAQGFSDALGVMLEPSGPSGEERVRAERLAADKYASDEWLFHRSPHPDATATALLKTPAGLVRLYLALSGDVIKSALFAGDFNEIPAPLAAFEAGLKWQRLDAATLTGLAAVACPDGTLDVAPDAIVDLVLEAGDRALTRDRAAPARDGSCYFPENDVAAAVRAEVPR